MPSVIREHRLLIFALVLALAVLLLAIAVSDSSIVHHARAAVDEARSSWGRFVASVLRSSAG